MVMVSAAGLPRITVPGKGLSLITVTDESKPLVVGEVVGLGVLGGEEEEMAAGEEGTGTAFSCRLSGVTTGWLACSEGAILQPAIVKASNKSPMK